MAFLLYKKYHKASVTHYSLNKKVKGIKLQYLENTSNIKHTMQKSRPFFSYKKNNVLNRQKKNESKNI